MDLAGCESWMISTPWVKFLETESAEVDLSLFRSLALTDAGALLQSNPLSEGLDVLSVLPCSTATS